MVVGPRFNRLALVFAGLQSQRLQKYRLEGIRRLCGCCPRVYSLGHGTEIRALNRALARSPWILPEETCATKDLGFGGSHRLNEFRKSRIPLGIIGRKQPALAKMWKSSAAFPHHMVISVTEVGGGANGCD
jgi:hypothetical protein